MKVKLTLVVLFSLAYSACKESVVDYTKSLSPFTFHIKQGFETVSKATPLKNGGMIYVGEVAGDGYAFAIDENGLELWYQIIGGSGRDNFTDVIEHSNGDIYAVGGTGSSRYGVETKESSSYVVRFGSDGSIKWAKSFGTKKMQFLLAIKEDPDGDLVVVGTDTRFSTDSYISKLNPEGEIIWSKTYELGPWREFMNCISFTSDGDYLVTGLTSMSARTNPPQLDIYENMFYQLDSETGEVTFGGIFDQFNRVINFNPLDLHMEMLQNGSQHMWVFDMFDQDTTMHIVTANVTDDGLLSDITPHYGGKVMFLQDVQPNEDGFLILAAVADEVEDHGQVGHNPTKCSIIQISPTGEELWRTEAGSSSRLQYPHAAQQTATGYSIGASSFSLDGGDTKFLYFDLDAQGVLQK